MINDENSLVMLGANACSEPKTSKGSNPNIDKDNLYTASQEGEEGGLSETMSTKLTICQ